MTAKIILPGQDVPIDRPNGVDPIWYEKLQALTARVNSLQSLIDAGGYSEGVWSPVLSAPGGTLPTFTATPLTGRYVRVGHMIGFAVYANNIAGGVVGAGNFALSVSLPIAAAADALPRRIQLGIAQNSGIENIVLGEVAAGTPIINLYKVTGTSQVAVLVCADLNNVSRSLELFGWYRVA